MEEGNGIPTSGCVILWLVSGKPTSCGQIASWICLAVFFPRNDVYLKKVEAIRMG